MRPDSNFLLEISAVDSIAFASYQFRRDNLRNAETHPSVEINLTGEQHKLNTIDMIPRKLTVREA